MSRVFLLYLALLPWPLSGSLASQTGLVVRGHYTRGPEMNTFQPCGTDVRYWVIGSPSVLSSLQDAYERDALGPYGGLYAVLAGWGGTEPIDGFADNYDGLWNVTRVDSARSRSDGDCLGAVPPAWITDETGIECGDDAVTTVAVRHCLLLELMLADNLLMRTVTAGLDKPRFGPRLYEEQRQWEAVREATCLKETRAFQGGSLQIVRLFACRLRMSHDRLMEVDPIRRGN